jgi:hypothetical protein
MIHIQPLMDLIDTVGRVIDDTHTHTHTGDEREEKNHHQGGGQTKKRGGGEIGRHPSGRHSGARCSPSAAMGNERKIYE